MSDVLEQAIRAAKLCRAPSVVNYIRNDQAQLDRLTEQNAAMKERIIFLERTLGDAYEEIAAVRKKFNLTRIRTDFPSVKEIIEATAKQFGITVVDIQSARRDRASTVPRQVAMYLAKTLTPLSYPAIGRIMRNIDHTTVLYGYQKIAGARKTDAWLDRNIKQLEELFNGGPPKGD